MWWWWWWWYSRIHGILWLTLTWCKQQSDCRCRVYAVGTDLDNAEWRHHTAMGCIIDSSCIYKAGYQARGGAVVLSRIPWLTKQINKTNFKKGGTTCAAAIRVRSLLHRKGLVDKLPSRVKVTSVGRFLLLCLPNARALRVSVATRQYCYSG